VLRDSGSGIRCGVDDTGVGSFLFSITGAGGGGGALAGRGAGGSSRLFHMLTLGGLQKLWFTFYERKLPVSSLPTALKRRNALYTQPAKKLNPISAGTFDGRASSNQAGPVLHSG
jgi:hypothetical protein